VILVLAGAVGVSVIAAGLVVALGDETFDETARTSVWTPTVIPAPTAISMTSTPTPVTAQPSESSSAVPAAAVPISDTAVAADPVPVPPPPPDAPAPDPQPAPVSPPSPCSGSPGGIAGALLVAMNADRGGGLCWNTQLAGFAQDWASVMASSQTLGHQDLNGLKAQTSFTTMGEDVFVGAATMTATDIESVWMNSPLHRANILNPAFTAAGVGVAYDNSGQVWICVDFAG
jgi:hypothetical protein